MSRSGLVSVTELGAQATAQLPADTHAERVAAHAEWVRVHAAGECPVCNANPPHDPFIHRGRPQ